MQVHFARTIRVKTRPVQFLAKFFQILYGPSGIFVQNLEFFQAFFEFSNFKHKARTIAIFSRLCELFLILW